MATRREHAQTLPLMAVVIVLVAAILVIVSRVGVLVIDRSRAHVAADAAALAAVQGGRPAAVAVAARNHGTIVSYDERDGAVEVRVRVGKATAVARAAPAAPDPPG